MNVKLISQIIGGLCIIISGLAGSAFAGEVLVKAPEHPCVAYGISQLVAALQGQRHTLVRQTDNPGRLADVEVTLRTGVALAQARAQGSEEKQVQAVAALERALQRWRKLSMLAEKYNRLPVLSNSKEPFSWAQLTPEVDRDIERARAPLGASVPRR